MENRNNKKAILYMTELALLSALVVVLQLLGTFVKIGPLPMSLVLVPIVIGACLLGIKAGAILGLVFGIVTAVMGITGADGFSLILFEARPFWFIVLCLLKATAAGFGAGVIYKALENPLGKNNKTLQTVIASVSAPILNTGIFVLGMLVFYFDTLNALPTMFPDAFGGFNSGVKLLFLGLAGLNFVGELVVSLVLSPAIVRIVDIVKHRIK